MGSREENQPNNHPESPVSSLQGSLELIQERQDFFNFLKKEERCLFSPSFFSENCLSQDILLVTDAEPDICLEVFYALYNTLWPQIEKQQNASLKDGWRNFVGGSLLKGVLCPPEKLIGKKKLKDIKRILSENQGEHQVFRDLDGVIALILDLKQKIIDYPGQLLQKEDIMASLDVTEGFYKEYRHKVITLAQAMIEKEQMNVACVSEYDALVDLLEPKAVMMGDVFQNHWAYRIPRNKAQKLLSLDENERPIENDSTDPSSHRVAALPEKSEAPEPLVYFKANGGTAIQPEKEYMLWNLFRHLKIPVPETALLILTEVFEENPNYFYAVQASEAVVGESALEACQNQERIFEQEAYVSQVIGTLLTNPLDGSFKNFKYSPKYKTLIGIDNDLIFEDELAGQDGRNINVKSVLYLLPSMDKPIPASIQTYFATLDPDLVIFIWLRDLHKKNEKYEFLFTRLSYQHTRAKYQTLSLQDQIPSLAACLQEKPQVDLNLLEIHRKPFSPRIMISKDLLNSLAIKLQITQRFLLNNCSASPQILFEKISPILGKYYQRLRLKFQDPKEALEALWGDRNEDGRSYCCLLSFFTLEELNNNPINNENSVENERKEERPEEFFEDCRKVLTFDNKPTPLDNLIKRHSERKMKDLLDLPELLKELQFLRRERLTDSKSLRDLVDFWYNMSKITEKHEIVQEIRSLLSNLPLAELQWLLTLEKYFLRSDASPLEASSPTIYGAFLKQRIFNLTESEKMYLFDDQGSIKKNDFLTGRSNVTCFPEKNPAFYLKQHPEWPGYEFASLLFMRMIGISHLPFQDFIIVDSKYPVLLTQKVDGDPVFRVWKNLQAFNSLDPVHTGLLIISAMLINPEDGKEDNYILSQDQKYLIPIDNDHCFLPSTFQKEGGFWNAWTVNTALQTKTILFCLDEMNKPVPSEAKQCILSIDFNLFLKSWMKELIKVEDRYNYLVDQDQRNVFLENGTILRIPFYEEFIHNLYWKVNKIQDLLRSTSEQTPFSLLKAVEPFAARCYQDSFQYGATLQSRFQAATKLLYIDKTKIDGSRVSILNTRSMMNIINVSENDLQNDATYNKMGPSDALELLKLLSEKQSENKKAEQNLLCELDEKNKGGIWTALFGKPLLETTLKNFFLSPKEGLSLKGSKLIVSSKLRELFALTPDQGTKIKFLSLQGSPLLTHRTVRTLVEGCPNLEYLNVSGCEKLQEILTATGEWPLLVRLEAQECPILEKCICYSPLRVLRIGTSWKIEIVVEEPHVDVLDVFMEKRKFDFHFKKGQGFGIRSENKEMFLDDLANFSDPLQFFFFNFKVKIGDYSISSGEELRHLVSFLEVRVHRENPRMIKRISQLNLVNLKKLVFSRDDKDRAAPFESTEGFIDSSLIFETAFKMLTLGEWLGLEELDLRNTTITPKGIQTLVNEGSWPRVKSLNISGSQLDDQGLEILAKGDWPFLETLDLSNTSVTTKGVVNLLTHASWPNIREIIFAPSDLINQDQVKSLLPENWPLLERLDLCNTKLALSRFKKIGNQFIFPRLKSLKISDSEICEEEFEFFFLRKLPFLEELFVGNTNLPHKGIETILKESNWPQLKRLFLSWNEISEEEFFMLSLKDWPQLEEISLQHTKLTSKGIEAIVNQSHWLNLKCLYISFNAISDEGIMVLSKGNWPLLEELRASNIGMSSKGIEVLVNKCKWPNLRRLCVSENAINYPQFSTFENGLYENQVLLKDEAFHEGFSILSLGKWSFLEKLDLSHTQLTPSGIEIIVKTSEWPQLRYIDLSYNPIGNEGLSILSRGNWPGLETLGLKFTNFTVYGFLHFILKANWHYLKEESFQDFEFMNSFICDLFPSNWFLLQRLDLCHTKITSAEILAITKNFRWPKLKYLDISENQIFGKDFPMLSLTNWPLLEELYLVNTGLALEGIEIIVNKTKLPRLKRLDISFNNISDQGLKILACGEWPLLEHLDLTATNTTMEGIENLLAISKPKWQNLRSLHID